MVLTTTNLNKKQNILFVCTGNINRSPAAEIILRQLTQIFNTDSAGISDAKHGKTTKRTMEALERKGFVSEPVKSNKITKEQFDWANIIYYMQPSHLNSLQKCFPAEDLSKAKPLVMYSTTSLKKIIDPHFDGRHDLAIDQLLECLHNMLYIMGIK